MANQNPQLPTSVTTPRFRNSFPHIFSPQFNKLGKKMEYSLQAIFEKTADLEPLKIAMKNACINKWGSDPAKWPTNVLLAEAKAKWGPDPAKWEKQVPILKNPFKSQKSLIEAALKKGQPTSHLDPLGFYLVLKTGAKDKNGKDKPHPIVVGKNPKEVIEEESRFYAGCWAKANVNAGAYETGDNFGVTFYLNACQFVGDADPFSGRASPEAAFEAIPEDVTEGGDATSMFS